jgi:phytoene dehydrogenase-like protein
MGVEVIPHRAESNICSIGESYTRPQTEPTTSPTTTLAAMGRTVVIGGGYGGLAAAVRLAKLGHEVTLLEAREVLGGAVGRIEQDGFSWETGPTTTLLPAVARDLFRKSGRPLERELDLVAVDPARRHRFPDGTEIDLPAGSRAAQLTAVGAAFGERAAEEWIRYVDDFSPVWEALRRDLFERPWAAAHASKDSVRLLELRLTLDKVVKKSFKDERMRQIALFATSLEGHNPRDVPAWQGMWAYLEQNFGVWTVPGGMHLLADVLAERLATRGVTVHTGAEVADLEIEGDRVRGVRADGAVIDADHVVVAIDPRRLPALARYVEATMPAIPPVVCHIGVVGEVPDLPHEVVLHGDPLLVLRTGGTAPPGAHAWTIIGRGRLAEDIVTALQRAGIRVRDQIEVRVDRSPRDLVQEWHGSPYGVLWQGRRSLTRRLGPSTPYAGVYVAGAHSSLGAGLPSVGLSAALVAQLVGPA